MPVFYRKDILKIERTRLWQMRRKHNKQKAYRAPHQIQEAVATAQCFPINIYQVKSILSWAQKRHLEEIEQKGEVCYNPEDITDDVRARWAVNLLRHKVNGYDRAIDTLQKQQHPIGRLLYIVYKVRILENIANMYPELVLECQQQINLALSTSPQLEEYYEEIGFEQ
ncbi:MAG: hypothetical protein NC218_03385 [Acetobacter sp.]|nr:hypothetical protein [Acetobacter sp.]